MKTAPAAAFFTTPEAPNIQPAIISYIEAFVPKSSGGHFNPRVPTGVAPKDYVDKILAEPFTTFTFSPAGASVYQLGDYVDSGEEIEGIGFIAKLTSYEKDIFCCFFRGDESCPRPNRTCTVAD